MGCHRNERNRRLSGVVEPQSGVTIVEEAPAPGLELITLMGRYAKGDGAAFERIFSLLAPRVYGFHLRTMGRASVAQDLTQQTFLKLHVARRRYRDGSPVEPWIFAIAKNVQRDSLRRRKRSREHLTEDGELPSRIETATEPPDEDLLLRRRIADAIACLPEGQRDVLVLHKFQGLSMKEVADTLGIGLSAAKVRAFRAYGALRQLLGRDPV